MNAFYLIVSSLLIACNAAYVNNIKKCSINDKQCQKEFFVDMFNKWTTSGFPELKIETLDPLIAIEKDTISLTDELNVVINKGIVKGFKNCEVKGYGINLNKGVMSYHIFCDLLNVDAALTLAGSNALLQALFGSNQLHGSHIHGTVTVEKIGIQVNLGCKVIKGDDGKTYFTLPENKVEHKYEVENVKVNFDKLIIGDQNLGPLLTDVINANTNVLLDSFGTQIVDKVLEYLIFGLEKFYSQVPTQNFISEDLSS